MRRRANFSLLDLNFSLFGAIPPISHFAGAHAPISHFLVLNFSLFWRARQFLTLVGSNFSLFWHGRHDADAAESTPESTRRECRKKSMANTMMVATFIHSFIVATTFIHCHGGNNLVHSFIHCQ
jgi:hypothetical protein